MDKKPNPYLVRLIDSGFRANRLARMLGVSEATLSRWRNGQQIPVRHAVELAAISKGSVTAAELLGIARKAA